MFWCMGAEYTATPLVPVDDSRTPCRYNDPITYTGCCFTTADRNNSNNFFSPLNLDTKICLAKYYLLLHELGFSLTS